MRIRLLSVLFLVACGRHDKSGVKLQFDAAKADSAAAAPLALGDVRVKSTDGSIILGVVGDTVTFQLSDSLRNKVKQDIDTAGGNGIGNMIARQVSGVVSSAMGFVAHIPVQEIDNVRYEDGRIQFESKNKHSGFTMTSRGDKGNATFTQEDGERFVAAVKARQAALKQ